MMSVPQFVLVVDDADPSIQYNGSWISVNYTHNFTLAGDIGTRYGTPFQNTLHSTSDNASLSLSFNGMVPFTLLICFRAYSGSIEPFSGTVVRVYGTYIINGTQGPPTWDCFIDSSLNSDAIVYRQPPPPINENNFVLCYGQVQDGNHKVIVKTNVDSDNQQNGPFLFDRMEYVPSANDSLLNESLLSIDSSDVAITYSLGWQLLNEQTSPFSMGSTHYTERNGAWFTFNFNGS
jgi:hypothetical protein